MRLVIVSGLSGSGKSITLHTLEDAGFYCIDNLPVGLLPTFAAELTRTSRLDSDGIALGIDARNLPEDLRRFPQIIAELGRMGIDCELVFLDADDDSLIKRFSETRRKHPLTDPNIPLKEAIQKERQLLQEISEHADLHIDTSHTNIHQLRDLVRERIERKPSSLSVLFQSFGFKHGVPADADFVFDVRCLPNPNWEPTLRSLTGLDPAVAEFLQAQPSVVQMFDSLKIFLETWIPNFQADNRSYLTVAIGCTGGQHRSVYLVNLLFEHFRDKLSHVTLRHRELS